CPGPHGLCARAAESVRLGWCAVSDCRDCGSTRAVELGGPELCRSCDLDRIRADRFGRQAIPSRAVVPRALGRYFPHHGWSDSRKQNATLHRRLWVLWRAWVKWAMVAVISASSALADVLQSAGMRDHGEIDDFRPRAVAGHLARLIRNRNMLIAVVSLAVSFFAFLALISVSELSFAVPATAATYVLETILARCLLKEHVDWHRWAGATLVAGGVALLMV